MASVGARLFPIAKPEIYVYTHFLRSKFYHLLSIDGQAAQNRHHLMMIKHSHFYAHGKSTWRQ